MQIQIHVKGKMNELPLRRRKRKNPYLCGDETIVKGKILVLQILDDIDFSELPLILMKSLIIVV